MHAPSYNPDEEQTLDDVCDSPDILVPQLGTGSEWWSSFGSTARYARTQIQTTFSPFLNRSTLLLM